MAFDATAGGADSNSYCTVAVADAYHDMQPLGSRTFVPAEGETTWEALSTASKERRCMLATALLDRLVNWSGTRRYGSRDSLDLTGPHQRLQMPRYGLYDRDNEYYLDPDKLAEELQHATAEYAGQLGEPNRTADDDVETASIKGIRAGKVDLKFDKPEAKPLPDSVFYMLPSNWVRGVRQRSRRSIRTMPISR